MFASLISYMSILFFLFPSFPVQNMPFWRLSPVQFPTCPLIWCSSHLIFFWIRVCAEQTRMKAPVPKWTRIHLWRDTHSLSVEQRTHVILHWHNLCNWLLVNSTISPSGKCRCRQANDEMLEHNYLFWSQNGWTILAWPTNSAAGANNVSIRMWFSCVASNPLNMGAHPYTNLFDVHRICHILAFANLCLFSMLWADNGLQKTTHD